MVTMILTSLTICVLLLQVSISVTQEYYFQTFAICKMCECKDRSAAPWGLPGIDILCKDFEPIELELVLLPSRTRSLTLRNNNLIVTPNISTTVNNYTALSLDLSDNQIKSCHVRSFAFLEELSVLNLHNNEITDLFADTFAGAHSIRRVDLSANMISSLPLKLFLPLTKLEYLDLSYNPLGRFFDNGPQLFQAGGLAVNPGLHELHLNNIQLSTNNVSLQLARSLSVLSLRNNPLMLVPLLPRSLNSLDISGTSLNSLKPHDLPVLQQLDILILQDVLSLKTIDAYSLYGLNQLEILRLDGCRNLTTFNVLAFGQTVLDGEHKLPLRVLSLQGTHVQSLNSTLRKAFEDLDFLDLSGAPWKCDCESKWLRDFKFDVMARCAQPPVARGRFLTELPVETFKCSQPLVADLSSALTLLLVLLLLVLCGLATWLVCVGLRPSRRSGLSFVGPHPHSPYAQVTIEPNRAE